MKSTLSIVVLLLAAITAQAQLETRSVRVQWELSPGPGVTRYKVYWSTEPGIQVTHIPATLMQVDHPTRLATITGLSVGTTYYIAVTALNSAGGESSPSNEISYVVPAGPEPPPAPAAPGDLRIITVSLALQASNDLNEWNTFYVLQRNSAASSEFYRLLIEPPTVTGPPLSANTTVAANTKPTRGKDKDYTLISILSAITVVALFIIYYRKTRTTSEIENQ